MYRWIQTGSNIFGDFFDSKEWEKVMNPIGTPGWVSDVFAQHCSPDAYKFNQKTNQYEIELSVPGWEPSDITIELKVDNGCVLRVTGNAEKNSFHRVYKLASEVDTDNITSELRLGILKIYIPRKINAPKGRKVPVTVV